MSCGNKIFKSDLPIKMSPNTIEKDTECKEIGNLKDAVEKVEIKLIRMAFDNAGNVRDAAKILGINSSTFFRKRKRYLEMGML